MTHSVDVAAGAIGGVALYRILVRHLIRYTFRKPEPKYAQLAFRIGTRLLR